MLLVTHRRDRRLRPRARGHADDDLDLLEVLARAQRPASPPATAGPRATGTATPRPSVQAADPGGRRADAARRCARVLQACAAPPRLGHAPPHPAARRASGGRPASSSSTTCSCWPASCCATRCRAPWCAGAARALPAPAARRVPGHRPHPDRAGRAHRRRRPGHRGRRPAGPTSRSTPGRLFFVGDPKQSIYRFRRADISTFLEAKDRFGPAGGGPVELTANFRTGRADHRLGQHHLRRAHGRGARRRPAASPRSPRTPPLHAAARAPAGGPPVAVIGRRRPPARRRSADVLRAAEAGDVAARHRRGHGRGLAGRTTADERAGGRARLGDITILVPGPHLAALPRGRPRRRRASRSGPSRARSSTPAGPSATCSWCCGRSTTPPTTSASSSALRTPLFGCGDDDLFRYKVERQGQLELQPAPQPDTVPTPARCAAGLAYLRELHEARHWRSPAELLDRIARDRRALELGFAEGRPRDVWRRLRFVIDQARAWSEATGGSLRELPAVGRPADRRGRPGRRGGAARDRRRRRAHHDDPRRQGPGVPDHDRVGHVHRHPGAAAPGRGRTSRATAAPWATGSASDVITEEFEAWKPIDEQMGFDERIRLLYVACTRACDHLVVSLHRKVERKTAPQDQRTAPTPSCSSPAWARCSPTCPTRRAADADPAGRRPPPPPRAARRRSPSGQAERAPPRSPLAARRPRRGAPPPRAHRRAAAPDCGERDEPQPSRPRAAEAAPRPRPAAVAQGPLRHRRGPGRARRAPDHRPGHRRRPRRRRRRPVRGRGRARPGRRRARPRASRRSAPRWCRPPPPRPTGARSTPARPSASACSRATSTSSTAAPRAWWWSTTRRLATRDPAELDRRVEGYRLQGAAYALAVAPGHRRARRRVVFLFLTPHGAVERDLADLDAAMADVERLVAAGHELVTP